MFIGVLLWKPLAMSQWSDNEAEHCQFKDKRIGDRFRQILGAVSSLPGESIPHIYVKTGLKPKLSIDFYQTNE